MGKVEVVENEKVNNSNQVRNGAIGFVITLVCCFFFMNYLSNSNSNLNSLPSNIQGIYINKGFRNNTSICDTIAFKLNSNTVQHQLFSSSLGCTKNFNFDNKAVVYNVQNVKKIGGGGEDYYFELYSNGVKEYECNRVFGSMTCTSKSGTLLGYKQYNE